VEAGLKRLALSLPDEDSDPHIAGVLDRYKNKPPQDSKINFL
jgi:hypothetical protein